MDVDQIVRKAADAMPELVADLERLVAIPSRISLTVQGGRPSKTRMVPRWAMSPLMSSAAPRP